jgi:hypothetical protein
MFNLLCLPVELIIRILEHFDPQAILALRQVHPEWRHFIDGEEISRFLLLYHPSFTFRGKPLRHQPEVARYGSPGNYGTCMRHLSSRLRGLDGKGPTFAYSIKHPYGYKFCYGSKFLALETRQGEEIEIREINSGKLLHDICMNAFLGPTTCRRTLLDIRIRDSILSMALIEENIHLLSTDVAYEGLNFILFFALKTDSVKLLLKVPRIRQNFARDVERSDCLYDFNEALAVICTARCYQGCIHTYYISVWSLRTGEMMMSEISSGPVRAISVGQGDEWSVLREISAKFAAPGSLTCIIMKFHGAGESYKYVFLPLLTFMHEHKWIEERLPPIGSMEFEIFKSSWGLTWRQPVQGGWKIKVFTHDKLTSKSTGGWVILSHSRSCLGRRVYVNFSAEYIVIPHNLVSLREIPKLSYLPLRSGRKSNNRDSNRDQGVGSTSGSSGPDCMTQEHWIACDEKCESLFSANDVPDIAPSRDYNEVIVQDLDIFGDEEFLISRMGDIMSVFTFDSCKILPQFQKI